MTKTRPFVTGADLAPSAFANEPMPFFIVEAYADDCKVTANHWSAQMAFADAVDWRLVKRLSNVAISDGNKVYSIREFATALKQPEISGGSGAALGEDI